MTFFRFVAVLSVPVVLLAPAMADSQAALEPGDVERGALAYVADCAECHRTPARFMARVEGADAAAKAATLDAFLPDHYAPDDQTRADIIAWLLAQ